MGGPGYTYKQSLSEHRGVRPTDPFTYNVALEIIDEMQQDEQGIWADATKIDIQRYYAAIRRIQLAFAVLELVEAGESEAIYEKALRKIMDSGQVEAKQLNKLKRRSVNSGKKKR